MTGQKLKQYLKERGTSARWLADKMGISAMALSYKLNGKSKFFMEDGIKIKKICRMTNTEFDSIFNEESWYKLI